MRAVEGEGEGVGEGGMGEEVRLRLFRSRRKLRVDSCARFMYSV